MDCIKLHSAYNPVREAERYIESLNINKDYSYFILIECGLEYVIPFLRTKSPCAKIISLHIKNCFLQGANAAKSRADAEWSAETGEDLNNFLESEISDTLSSEIKIIEWRVAFNLFPNEYLKILEVTALFIKRIDANKRTENYFIPVWQKNIKKNSAIVKNICKLQHTEKNIIIAGPSPNLKKDIPLIKKLSNDDNYLIMALSSAFPSLDFYDIDVHIVVTSDAGFWARLHFYELIRSRQKPVIAAPDNAALLSHFEYYPCALFPKGELKERGTVSAYAIDIALAISSGNIYISGIDMEKEDILFHLQPYMLDVFLKLNENKLSPFYSILYERMYLTELGGTYKIYKDWFTKKKYPPRIYFLSQMEKLWHI